MRRFALFLLVFALQAQVKKPITLEALGSARRTAHPAPEPVWAPDGKRFLFTESGKVWLFDTQSRAKTALFATQQLEAAATRVPEPEAFPFENRRVREQQVQWAPGGRELLVSAGGDLFLFRVGAGGWNQLTATAVAERDPKLSPDGRRVSFRRGHDLYVLDIASKKVTRLTHNGSATLLNGELDWVYPEELDLGTAYWWSPDSRQIGYLQFDVSREPVYPHADLLPLDARHEPQRYPQAGDPNPDVRLGVVSAEGGRTRWMDLGSTRDALLARVQWTPDSKALVATRLNRVQNRLDLLLADAGSAAARPVLHESDPYWINTREDLRFLKGGQEFLWASERDGFQHLYRYSIDGRLLAQLTRGDWEVTEVACVDESSGQVYFLSTEAGPLERHLYKVPLEGGGRRRISGPPGTHEVSMGPGCGSYIDTYSSLASPPRRALHRNDGTEAAVLEEPDRTALDEYEVLPYEIVQVQAADGTVLYGRLLKPAGVDPSRKYPVVVKVYGGPNVQSVQNHWIAAPSVDQVLAHQGFVVWALDNRGSFYRGHKFESAVFRDLGAVELEDQKAGIERLVSLGIADPKRIGIYGWSYGGYMTLYSLLHAPELFAAGVAGAPVTHWRNYDTIYTERYMGLPSENADGYRKSSPLEAAGNLKAKLLIVHNLEDDNVLFQNTLQMADALQRAGKQFGLMVYPAKSHGLSPAAGPHYNEMLVDFFEKNLK
jgi:dipeptidyl-peptidase-4